MFTQEFLQIKQQLHFNKTGNIQQSILPWSPSHKPRVRVIQVCLVRFFKKMISVN